MHYHDGKTAHRSPQNYKDLDGNMRTFTEIDLDKKTKISVPSDGTDPKVELKNYRDSVIEKILSINAGHCPSPFTDYVIKGEAVDVLTWNESMLRDDGTPLDRLVQLYTLASNKAAYYESGIRV
jgi:hypothetical protein